MLYLKTKLFFDSKAHLSRLNIKQNTYLSAIFFDVCDAPTTWYIHTATQIQILY